MKRNIQLTYSQILYKLEYFCAYTDRCSYDIAHKMKTLEVPLEWQELIWKHLEDNNYYSDYRYIENYVIGKLVRKKEGVNKVRYALIKKKLDPEIIDQVIRNYYPSEINQHIAYWIEKKWIELFPKHDYQKALEKLVRYLISKGYSYSEFKSQLPARS